MKNVDMITLMYVGGELKIEDRWSTAESVPAVDPAPCKDDITNIKGTYSAETGAWSASFTRPLTASDLCDTLIVDK